ncbi:MAG TPA: DJ-1/PfpI family protein [Syntrophobacteraceae bacterium]|nr:DJ-1/PfpI family protein [Syntrophobacteraceae bacterium]
MNFGVLVFPDVEELDFIGPWEIVGMWSKVAGGPENRFIVAQSREPVICAKGLSVNPDVSFDQCPQLDFLLVPGGQGTRREVDNPILINFISEQAKRSRAVLSVCTGTFLLHKAGLPFGKRATTHWNSLDRLRAIEETMAVEERFVRDGNIWTSAGISAGIDLLFALIAEIASEESAGKVQFAVEYYPSTRRYGSSHKSPMAPGYLKEKV